MIDIKEEIRKNRIGNLIEKVDLSKCTTYRVGGHASVMVSPRDVEKLIDLIKILKNNNIKYKILGNGSNIIFSDEYYDGVIIKLDNFNHLKINDTVVTVGAGYNLMKLAYTVSSMGLKGLEFATGIPGTVGGAIYMNAGAYKSDMGYIISSVRVLTPNYEVRELYNRDLNFHYRMSFLQEHKDHICLDATIVLKHGDKKEIMDLIEDRRQKRLISQPLEFPSAGSVFRNPTNDFAGHLIELCGLKGYKMGGAMVSLKHANFIVNAGCATAADVRNLIMYVKDKVKEEQNVELIVEQEFVNWE